MKHGCDDIRKMVIDGYKNGKFTQTEASRVTGYSRVTIGKWCRNEEYTAKPRGHRAAAFSEEELTQLAEFIENNVDATLAEIREHFGKNCSLSSVHRAIQKIKPEFPSRFSYHTSCPLKVSNAGVFLCGVNLQEFVDVVLNLGRLRGDNYPLEDFCMLIRHVGEHCVNRVLAGANLQL